MLLICFFLRLLVEFSTLVVNEIFLEQNEWHFYSPQIFGDEELFNSDELQKVISELNESVEKFDKEIEECQKQERKLEHRILKAIPATSEIETDETASLMHCEFNLRKEPGSKPSKYGLNLAKELFTQTELFTQMCDPSRSGEGYRTPLDVKKTVFIKKAVLDRFKRICWPEAKEAISRLGRSAKNEQEQAAKSQI